MTPRLETCKPTGFRFIPIHRESIVVPATGMRDMVHAAANRPADHVS